jgi:hypothetical protein
VTNNAKEKDEYFAYHTSAAGLIGTTCAVAKSMNRHYIGIDIVPEYVTLAEQRVRDAPAIEPLLLVGRPSYPGRDELIAIAAEQVGNAGKAAGTAKHKRRTYGRTVPAKNEREIGA